MKQQKTVRYTIVSTLIIIGLFVFCYIYFIRPIYLNNIDHSETIFIKKEQRIRFGKHENQDNVFGIELEITGNATSNLDIIISNQEGDQHIASVKGESLDFTYKNEWYDDSCFLTILPKGKPGGRVNIVCRFLSMD